VNTFRFVFAVLLLAPLPCVAQHPVIFDVSTVVVGSQRVNTLWAYASGKWSDADPDLGLDSTEIHCYKRFGFCELANASSLSRVASVGLFTFDILRWNASEMVAVDTSPLCVMNTLRFDFPAKKVSIRSTSKGETRDKVCRDPAAPTMATAFLTGAVRDSEPKTK
jgi:hypothetical protein